MIEDFFEILSRDAQDEKTVWKVRLLLDSSIYKVHFPGTPITPGACQLEIVRALAVKEQGMPLEITSVKNIKYLQIVDPLVCDTIEVSETFKPMEDGTLKCSAVISEGEAVMTKVSLVLKKQSF